MRKCYMRKCRCANVRAQMLDAQMLDAQMLDAQMLDAQMCVRKWWLPRAKPLKSHDIVLDMKRAASWVDWKHFLPLLPPFRNFGEQKLCQLLDFKNLLKVDSLADCSNDAAWKSVAQNYTALNLGLDNQQTSLKVLQKLVIQVSVRICTLLIVNVF